MTPRMNAIREEFIEAPDLAEFLGISLETLYRWNREGKSPKHYRIGKKLQYRQSDVEAWIEEQVVTDEKGN